MIVTNYQKYLKSDYWKSVKAAVHARDGHLCQACGCGGSLTAHHKTYDHLGEELEHLDDLVSLCWKCHRSVHHKVRGLQSNLSRPKRKVKHKVELIRETMKEITGIDIFLPPVQQNRLTDMTRLPELTTINRSFLDRLAATGTIYEGAHHWDGHQITLSSHDQFFLDLAQN